MFKITRNLIRSPQIYKCNFRTRLRPYGARFSSTNLDEITLKTLHPLLQKRAAQLEEEFHEMEEKLSNASTFNADDQIKYTRLAEVTGLYDKYKEEAASIQELKLMLEDPTLKEDAKDEIEIIESSLESLISKLEGRLLPPREFADKKCMLELRAGIGGDEANIFTEDLLNMYQAYAMEHKWPSRLLSKTKNGSSLGITEAILAIDHSGSYERLRFEGGVHRVQRIPLTDTKNRIQTSTAAVVVLPQMSDAEDSSAEDERVFGPDELRIDIMRSRGAGGQHVNTTESAVRIIHLPTGISVSMQDERSQHQNKAKALFILRGRLAEKERLERIALEKSKRTSQVTTTERSDKIRTYHYPQNRITDHRCKFSQYILSDVLAGKKLDEVIDEMDAYTRQEELKELLESST